MPRRIRRLLTAVTVLAAAVAGSLIGPTAAQAAVPGTPMYCYQTLNCSVEDFNALSLSQRLVFIRALSDNPAQQFKSGFADWRAIEGIIEFFQDRTLGATNSWVSYTDAGIMHGIERGVAMATHHDSYGDEGDPGADNWKTFLLDLQAGRLGDPVNHDREWGLAEQTSTDYGTTRAAAHGVSATNLENKWFQFSQLFRAIMQNESNLYNIPLVGGLVFRNILPNLTQVTNSATTYYWSTVAWNTSSAGTMLLDLQNGNWVQLGSDLLQFLNSPCSPSLPWNQGGCAGGGGNPPSIWSGPCSGYTCDDLDPTLSWNSSTGVACSSSSTTVVQIPADNGTLQMRWGNACQVNWARFIPNGTGTSYYIWVGRQSPGWNTPGYQFSGTAGVAAFSNQVYAPGPARVCVLQWNGTIWTNQVCTNFF